MSRARTPGFGLTLLVAALAWLAPFSIDTYLPSFPAIGRELDAGDAALQATLGVYLLAFALATLVHGPLSDAFGRRRVLLASLVVYVAASLAGAFVAGIEQLIVLRALQGLSASGGLVIGRAIIRDRYAGPEAQKAMSTVMMLFALAPAVAPLIGGWLHAWFGWRSVFVFLALLGAVVGALAWWRLGETLSKAERVDARPANVARLYGRALRHPRFMALVLMIAFNFAGSFLYIAAAPVVLYRHLGLGAEQFGYLFLPLVAGVIIGAFVSRRLAAYWSPARTAALGTAIMLVASAVNLAQAGLMPVSVVTVVSPVALYALGVSVAMPALSLLALECFPANRGMASAMQSFVQTGVNAGVAGLAVPLLAGSVVGLAWSMAGFLVTSLLVAAFWLPRTRSA